MMAKHLGRVFQVEVKEPEYNDPGYFRPWAKVTGSLLYREARQRVKQEKHGYRYYPLKVRPKFRIARMTKQNPPGVPMNKWIRGAGFRFRRAGGRLLVDVKRLKPRRKAAGR
jgi:hypothetical protein